MQQTLPAAAAPEPIVSTDSAAQVKPLVTVSSSATLTSVSNEKTETVPVISEASRPSSYIVRYILELSYKLLLKVFV